MTDLQDEVLSRATAVAGGDAARAREWFLHEKLPAFAGATAAELVERGRAQDVLAYLEHLEGGPSG